MSSCPPAPKDKKAYAKDIGQRLQGIAKIGFLHRGIITPKSRRSILFTRRSAASYSAKSIRDRLALLGDVRLLFAG